MFVQDVEHMNFKFEELPNILKSESSRLSEWKLSNLLCK